MSCTLHPKWTTMVVVTQVHLALSGTFLLVGASSNPIVAHTCCQDKLWELLPAGRLQIHRFAPGLSPGLRGGADFLLQEWGGEETQTHTETETRSNSKMF